MREAKKEWLAHREAVEGELQAANRRVEELEEIVADSEKMNVEKAKESVRRERARTRRAEKQLQVAEAEVEDLKKKLQEKAQQQFQGPLENLTHESPEVVKLHKLVETYKNEARSLRAMVDARKPEKLAELQDDLKSRDEEESKLRDEIKILKGVMARQERDLKVRQNPNTHMRILNQKRAQAMLEFEEQQRQSIGLVRGRHVSKDLNKMRSFNNIFEYNQKSVLVPKQAIKDQKAKD